MPLAEHSIAISPISLPQKEKTRRTDIRTVLNMRIRPEMRELIDHAAELTGKNRTDFVLDAARQAALNAVLDQTSLSLKSKSYEAFVALLDAPPNPSERLRNSLQTKPLWD